MTFEQFLLDTAAKGGSINIMFEERLFALIGTLERIARPLAEAGIPYELIGGAAVMIQVDRVDKSAVRNTKDIDIMVHRTDLEQIKEVAARNGFTFRHAAGLDMLIPHGEDSALNAVHLILGDEKVRPAPEYVIVNGIEVAVVPVQDLVQMKLTSHRDIDRVHIRDLDSVGLITVHIEDALPFELRERLLAIRRSE